MLLILFLLIPEEKNILESFDNSFYLKQLKLSLPVIHVHCQYLCLLEPPYPKLSSYAFAEGWHGKIKKLAGKSHPNIYEAVISFKSEQASQFNVAGCRRASRKKKYRNHENRLKTIKEKHEAGYYTLQELLRAYSHWLSL